MSDVARSLSVKYSVVCIATFVFNDSGNFVKALETSSLNYVFNSYLELCLCSCEVVLS